MPNWCSNKLVIEADPNVLDEIEEILKPPPPDTTHPAVATEYEQTPCLWFSGLLPQPADLPEKMPLMMDGCLLAAETEGWYAWRCTNWGTKWEPSYSVLGDCDEDSLVILFDTAWSPPIPFFQALADKFPTADITLLFYEGGCDFSGVCHWHNGVFTDISPEDGQTHAEFLEPHGWFVASFDEVEDDDQDRDYEVDGEDYEDEEGTEAPLEWDDDGELLTFEELAGDDIEEKEEEGAKEQVQQIKVSSLQRWADD